MKPAKYILPIIVISQFFCTSLWFAGNGVLVELTEHFGLGTNAIGYLTSSVQFGFIAGTLIFALLCISDRFCPSKVFFASALAGAFFNWGVVWEMNNFLSILIFRFLTGFFLAGIYPVGMKIAADYFAKGLGKALGFLVGALVLGTAFPHLLQELKGDLSWKFVLVVTSSLAILGGLLMLILIPDGPHRKPSQKIDFAAIPKIFKVSSFRSAAFGYFGHMWELYTFWAFIPFMLQLYENSHGQTIFNIPLLSFVIIGVGAFSCVIGGFLAERFGVKKVASRSLLLSCLCCMISPLIFHLDSQILFVSFMIFWGMVVIADSPLFSTLVAQNAPNELKGTALTIVTSIGFFLTIISIQTLEVLRILTTSPIVFSMLAIGPILGLVALRTNQIKK